MLGRLGEDGMEIGKIGWKIVWSCCISVSFDAPRAVWLLRTEDET